MSIVLVANTPHSAALIIPAIAQLHPDAGPVITIAATRTAFSFPEKTPYRDFPMIRNVGREPFLAGHGFAPRRKTSPISIDEAVEELSSASVVYLFFPGPEGFRFHCHAEMMVRSRNTVAQIRVIEDHPLSPSATVRAIETAALIDDYRPLLDAVVIEEHFRFNFHLNCYPLVTTLFERTGSKAWHNLSAGALQMLLWLRSLEKGKGGHSFTARELEIKAGLWTGSDEFPRIDSFGRRISLRDGPLYDHNDPSYELCNMRLLNDEESRLELTKTGRYVADAFPSICYDADLPFRIEAWKRMPVDEAVNEIDAYLMSFFGFCQTVLKDNPLGEIFARRGA
jgi:hypothetical protein